MFFIFLKKQSQTIVLYGWNLNLQRRSSFFYRFYICIYFNININTNHSYISLQQREKKPEIPAAATIALIYRTEKIYEKKNEVLERASDMQRIISDYKSAV